MLGEEANALTSPTRIVTNTYQVSSSGKPPAPTIMPVVHNTPMLGVGKPLSKLAEMPQHSTGTA